MPPNKIAGKTTKAKAAAAAPPSAELSLKLRGGEKDRSNTEYPLVLEDALTVIDANPTFNNMVGAAPRPISSTATETGFQSVFDLSHILKCHEVRRVHRGVQSLLGAHAVECNSRSAAALGGGATVGEESLRRTEAIPGSVACIIVSLGFTSRPHGRLALIEP